jgi:hypothetical protein
MAREDKKCIFMIPRTAKAESGMGKVIMKDLVPISFERREKEVQGTK